MKVLKWLDEHFEETLMVVVLAVMVVVLMAQIIFRKFLGSSLAWPEELCRYLFIWSGFLSLSYTIHNHSTMKTDLFLMVLPKAAKKWISLITDVGMCLLFAFLTKISFDVIPTITQVGTAIPISRKWVFAAAFVGFFLSAVRSLQEIIREVKHKEGGQE